MTEPSEVAAAIHRLRVHHAYHGDFKILLDSHDELIAKLADPQHGFFTYAHMCRDEHEQIGHNDSEHEMCPLCRVKAERDELAAKLAKVIEALHLEQQLPSSTELLAQREKAKK